jgi:hypothetical protein
MKRYLTLCVVGLFSAALTAVTPNLAGSSAQAIDSVGNIVVAAVGDMACDPANNNWNAGDGTNIGCAQNRVSDAILAYTTGVDAVFGLGDYQYDCSDPADWAASYDPSYGRLNAWMTPSVGNHEYKTGADVFGVACPTANLNAGSYTDYFTSHNVDVHASTYFHYSFNIGTSWHVIAMNGNCGKSGTGCGATGAETKWLKADLAVNYQPCVLAFWHQPRWTGTTSGDGTAYQYWWNALYSAHADVVLNGHFHNYQRYASLNPSGAADPVNGITEYVVGTGGEALAPPVKITYSPQPLKAIAKTFGYLRLTLTPNGWSADFVDTSGNVLDTSSGACHV